MNNRTIELLERILAPITNAPMIRLSKINLRQIYNAKRLSKSAYRDLFDNLPAGVSSDQLYLVDQGDELFIFNKANAKRLQSFL